MEVFERNNTLGMLVNFLTYAGVLLLTADVEIA
jgi:hypothetical protein